ncbi:MAG: family 78 glycoside hydrolase catalytic domain [Bacteroidetes bacterium]|nr:family 78 glycoside hydrolase catalytic domain [Bacteroidota bacterium]
MKKCLLTVSALFFFFSFSFAQVKLQNLLVENRSNPIGIDIIQPRFNWELLSDRRNTRQIAYEIKVTVGKQTVWSTGKVNSDSSVHVAYRGMALQSGKKYFWKVRVWDNSGKVSSWSEPAFFQMALLSTNDWKAKWITFSYKEDPSQQKSPLFRKQFNANKKIISATAYITAHGLYEALINGKKIGDAFLTPGWTSYNKRLQYQVYDVTDLLHEGNNAIGVTLGSGWYRGYLAWSDHHNIYGSDLSLLFQMEITYSDGTKENVVSDESWKCSTGPILSAEIYHGETYDAREETPGWATASYKYGSNWLPVNVEDFPFNNLIATYNEPVRKHEIFSPVKIFKTPKGEQVIDFGQNLVGWVVVKAKGNAGDKIIIRHAEVLDKQGNFYTENLRAAKSTDTYFLKGGSEETFEPHFTFHGFRYIKIEGYPGEIRPEDFTAVTLYSDMKQTGTFSCSSPLVNQLQHNIQWGQRGNFLDVPTDCPQRDERLGWTGDAQVFSRTASFNMNVNDFFAKWLKDVAADQHENGAVPHVIPDVLGKGDAGSAGWADVSTIVPWNMYIAYGDKRILEQQYPSMKAWVGFMTSKSNNYLWNTGGHFGDWLYYVDGGSTDNYLIAQCFYAHSTQLVINAARVLGHEDDVARYSDLLQKIKDAFMKEYATPNGRLISGTQTAYVLALEFDMFPENLRKQAAQRIVENIKQFDNHLTTGFLGAAYLCDVLTRFGYTDVASGLLLQTTYPSWLYPVKMGATTIWERWDGIKPDSTFEDAGMNSFNHYAYGCIGDWMYRKMAGLDTYEDGVGYKHIKVQPHPCEGFTNASASLLTYYGKLSNSWKTGPDAITMDVEIPANTTATVFLPASNANDITESGKSLSASSDIKITGNEEGYVVAELGSGAYHFVIVKK